MVGLVLLRRAQQGGTSAWTAMILLSWAASIVFAPLVLLGGTMRPMHLLWQPALVGFLFMAGQFVTFLAVRIGDVSVAAPVLGVKVLMVPAGATLIVGEVPSLRIWIAAFIAMVGVAFVQMTDMTVNRSKIAASVTFALLGALSMTIFDLLTQRWAPAWGAGYFLPLSFGFAAAISLVFLPYADRPSSLARRDLLVPLLAGILLMAIQALGITYTLARFGDASRVNIVYSLRGLWGVLLTWFLLHRSSDSTTRPSNRLMSRRLIGATFIGASVLIAVLP